MNTFATDVIYFLIAGTSFSLITLSIVFLFTKDMNSSRYMGTLLYFLHGFTGLTGLARRTGICMKYPHILYINYPAYSLLGPVTYYYFRSWIDGRIKFNFRQMLLFIPVVLTLIYCMPFFLLSAEEKLEQMEPVFGKISAFPVAGIIPLEYFLFGWIVFCLILFSYYTYSLLGRKDFKYQKQSKLALYYSLFWIIPIILLLYIYLFSKSLILYNITVLLMNCILIAAFLFVYSSPGFFNAVQRDAREIQYKKTRIKDLNVEAVLSRLTELMEIDYIYREENLSLALLSKKLKIAPYQLSEILNNRLMTNFKTYVNSYRIAEAKKLLCDKEMRNILSIAFQCGFNAKTTFNIVFHKAVGMTPSEYRRNFNK